MADVKVCDICGSLMAQSSVPGVNRPQSMVVLNGARLDLCQECVAWLRDIIRIRENALRERAGKTDRIVWSGECETE